MVSKYERKKMAIGRNKVKARQKSRREKQKRSKERLTQKQDAEKFGYHRMEGKSFGGRWVGFNSCIGEAGEVKNIEITEELKKKYEQ